MFETLTPSIESLQTELVELEAEISRSRARQLDLLRRLDDAQAPMRDGCRNLTEWVASRLDVAPETARNLVGAARKIGRWAGPQHWLGRGEMTLDRAVVNAELLTAGKDLEVLPGPFDLDISQMRRVVSQLRHTSPADEHHTFGDRYLSLQLTLDNSRWKLWEELPGFEGAVVEQALQRRADSFPALPDGTRPAPRQQAADALVAMAQDDLDGTATDSGTGSGAPVATIFVNASLVGASGGVTGVEIAGGPRVGPETLDRISCGGKVEITVIDRDQPIAHSPTAHAIPPKLRRFILWRDGGCAADGCQSRYRLQPHHIQHRADGGNNDPDNLVTLCWIHGYGYRIDPAIPKQRLRFLRPLQRAPPLAA